MLGLLVLFFLLIGILVACRNKPWSLVTCAIAGGLIALYLNLVLEKRLPDVVDIRIITWYFTGFSTVSVLLMIRTLGHTKPYEKPTTKHDRSLS